MNVFCLLLIAVTTLNITAANSASLDKISVKGKWFTDSSNRTVLFRGINAVKKEFPWIPDTKWTDMTNKTQIKYLSEWGFNVVRLGIMWAGLIPGKANKI